VPLLPSSPSQASSSTTWAPTPTGCRRACPKKRSTRWGASRVAGSALFEVLIFFFFCFFFFTSRYVKKLYETFCAKFVDEFEGIRDRLERGLALKSQVANAKRMNQLMDAKRKGACTCVVLS
jgi:hypothetical protein